MASKRIACASTRLLQGTSGLITRDPLLQCLTPALTRTMATEMPTVEAAIKEEQAAAAAAISSIPVVGSSPIAAMNLPLRRPPPPMPKVLTTVYSFPTMEPLRFEEYGANQLNLPLRRDILHRAVIFEGDAERQGTASTKWRSEVRGSGRKIRPQKGTGRARLGDKKSPMLRGGGVAFGPKPRDFSTRLPRKIYDLAWRTALSYRYRRGQLLLVDDGADLDLAEPRWFSKVMLANGLGNPDGRSLIVTADRRQNLWQAVSGAGKHGKVKTVDEVDVKNLLELGRLVMEKSVLDSLLAEHSSDLNMTVPSAVY